MVSPQIIDISTVMSRINRSSEVRRGFSPLCRTLLFSDRDNHERRHARGQFQGASHLGIHKGSYGRAVKPERFDLEEHILICRSGIHICILQATVAIPRSSPLENRSNHYQSGRLRQKELAMSSMGQKITVVTCCNRFERISLRIVPVHARGEFPHRLFTAYEKDLKWVQPSR